MSVTLSLSAVGREREREKSEREWILVAAVVINHIPSRGGAAKAGLKCYLSAAEIQTQPYRSAIGFQQHPRPCKHTQA